MSVNGGAGAAVIVDNLSQTFLVGNALLNAPQTFPCFGKSFPAALHGCVQLVKVKQFVLHEEVVGSRHLFEVVQGSPTVIAHALALSSLGFPVNHALQGVVCRGGFCGFFLSQAFLLGVGVFGYGCGLFGGSVGVLREQGKDSSLVKIVPQLPGCDRLCPVRREVGKPPPALLDGHTLPQQKGRKLVKAASLGKCLPYRPAQLRLVRFKLGGLGRLSGGFSGGVLFIKGKLPFLCRPVFPFGYPFLAAVQEVDLVKPLPVAHLHDFTLEIFHSGVGAAVLAALPCVGWSVHVGQKRDFINPQGVDDDMHMDIAAVVMPVRVGAYKGLVSGEMLFAELLAQLLRPVYGQAVVCPVPWVKADDIVVAFHIFPFLVFLIAEIGSHTGNSEILAPAVKGRNAVILPRYQPPVFIKGGLHGKLVMLKCEIGFRCAIVGIFRADMFECCQQRHPLSARLQTLGQQGRKPPPVPPRQAAGRGCATRSASGLSGLSCRRSCRIRRSASRQRQAARH